MNLRHIYLVFQGRNLFYWVSPENKIDWKQKFKYFPFPMVILASGIFSSVVFHEMVIQFIKLLD